jgi:homoserine O-acetyltransferase
VRRTRSVALSWHARRGPDLCARQHRADRGSEAAADSRGADKNVEDTVGAFISTYDANDLLYAFLASFDYDASPDLEKITAPFLLVNSADDFINPPELGLAEREMKRVKHGRFVMLPATETSHGHGMHSRAAFWQADLKKLLDATAPRK